MGRIAVFAVRHPLFAAALMMAAAVALADHWLPAAVIWVAAAAALAGRSGQWRRGLGWACCGALAVVVFSSRNTRRDLTERLLLNSGSHSAAGRVLRDAEGGGNTWQTSVALTDGPAAGARVRWLGRGEMPVAGARISAGGRFRPLPEPRNPGEFDQAAHLRRQGVSALFEARAGSAQIDTGFWDRLGARIRHGFRNSITAGLDEQSQAARTIRAVVIGEYPQDGDELVAAFRNSGTLHLFSVSGMHVGMVAGIGWLLFRWLGLPRRAAIGALLVLVAGYTWITGNGPPAVRAAWMTAAFLGAFIFRRQPDLLNSLGLVLFLAVLWDGNLLFQAGVQLSYGVVAAIAIGSPITYRWSGWIARPEPYLPQELMSAWQHRWLAWRRNLAMALAVSMAAFIGSAPLIAWHFGLLTPVSVVATVLLMPLVFALLAVALLAAALHPFAPSAAAVLNQGNAGIANACFSVAYRMAGLPGGNFSLRHNREPQMIIYDLDYGAGAAVFSAGNGGAVLFDCGDRFSFRSRLVPSLRRLGMTPDAVVLSHPDGHHLGGGAQVWAAFPIRQALLPVDRSLSRTYQSWCRDAPAAGITTHQAATVELLPLADDVTLEILHVPAPAPFTRLADDRVAVCRLHWHGWRILLMSDAGELTERELLASGRNLAAEVVVAGKHGRDVSLGDAFIRAVRPLAIIASNEAFPPQERLDARQVAFWRLLGIAVFDQAHSGGVTLLPTADGGLLMEGFTDGSRLLLERPR
jgi:ComEC/Rec2-related protein